MTIIGIYKSSLTNTLKVNNDKNITKQESPPAWTQEAYRPPRSKCSLCLVGGGVPHPVMMGGNPIIQTWPGGTQDTPHHPDLAGVPPPFRPGWSTSPPSRPGWGTPHHPDLAGVPPHHQDLAGVPPTIKTWPGYPYHPDLAGGYPGYLPPSRSGWGTPHHQDLTRVPPTIQTWLGYPLHHPDLTGVSPTIQTWQGYPPPSRPGWGTPPPVKVWTDKQTGNSTFSHPSDAGGNLVFPFFGLLNLSNFLKYWSSFFNKYRYKLCTCVNFEIYTCAQNLNTPVLITTRITYW